MLTLKKLKGELKYFFSKLRRPIDTKWDEPNAKLGSSIFWVGAHKTGTTYLQYSLEESKSYISENGVNYVSLDFFRENYSKLLNKKNHVISKPHIYTENKIEKLLIFDENIGAQLKNVIKRRKIYPDLTQRTKIVSSYFQTNPNIIVFGIRSLDNFLPSLYSEYLQFARDYVPFRHFLANGLSTKPDAIFPAILKLRWSDVLLSLSKAKIGKKLLVYQQEKLAGRERNLLSAVIGIPAAEFTIPQDHKRQRKLSAKASAKLESMNYPQKIDIMQIMAQYPAGPIHPAFDPWSQKERDALRSAYSQDLKRIQSIPRVEIADL